MGIYRCEDTERQRKIATGLRTLAMTNNGSRHPEELSDVGIYLCQVTERQRKIATGLKTLAMTKQERCYGTDGLHTNKYQQNGAIHGSDIGCVETSS